MNARQMLECLRIDIKTGQRKVESYYKEYGFRVEASYIPGHEVLRTADNYWEPPGEYMDYIPAEVHDIKYFLEPLDGPEIEIKEKDLPESIMFKLQDDLYKDIEENVP